MGARIIIANRSELFARGIARLLTEHGYQVAGITPTIREALALAAKSPDAVLLIDEEVDDGGATELVQSLIAANPGQHTIVLNGTWDVSEVVLALAAGAAGVIDKSCTPEHLFAAIDIVVGGGMVFSSQAVASLRGQLGEAFELVGQRQLRRLAMTPRENEVLKLLPTSMTLGQMAAHLYASRRTIQNNASSLYRKLGATGRAEAVLRAIELGLLEPRQSRDPAW